LLSALCPAANGQIPEVFCSLPDSYYQRSDTSAELTLTFIVQHQKGVPKCFSRSLWLREADRWNRLLRIDNGGYTRFTLREKSLNEHPFFLACLTPPPIWFDTSARQKFRRNGLSKLSLSEVSGVE
jgi:hypothetical protein